MDRHQLVIIAITAVISVIAKELVIWLASLSKATMASATARQRVRKIFSKNNLKIVTDILFISFALWTLSRDLRNPKAMVRMDIIWIVLDLTCLILFTGRLLVHISRISGKMTVSWGDKEGPPSN